MPEDAGPSESAGIQPELPRVWRHVLDTARRELGRDCVEQWLAPIRLTAVTNDLATLTAQTNFLADWVERNYGMALLRYLKTALPTVRRVTITVGGRDDLAWATAPVPAPQGATPPAAAAVPTVPAMPAGPSYLPQSPTGDAATQAPLEGRMTFENFVVGKPNELAHAAARRVAEGSSVSFNPVFLHGDTGLGKTHLMHAIVWHLHQTRPQCKVVYLSAENFMFKFIQALRFRDIITFKQQFRSADVLMIDDVQFIGGKDSTQEEFFHTFNSLIDLNRQIVLSADQSPDKIPLLESRICSRLQSGLVIDIHPADYELRLGVLQSKAESMTKTDPRFSIHPDLLDYLAKRLVANVRVLEGAMKRLYAEAILVGRPVTEEMIKVCLADLLRTADRKVTIDEIKRKVAEYYTLRLTDLVSPRRARAVARPRQVAMYLAKTLTAKSFPEIGRNFGGRDHTTVLHAVHRIEELMATDSQLADDVDLLRRALEG